MIKVDSGERPDNQMGRTARWTASSI